MKFSMKSFLTMILLAGSCIGFSVVNASPTTTTTTTPTPAAATVTTTDQNVGKVPIAVVDLQQIIQKSPQVQKIRADLAQQVEQTKKDFQAKAVAPQQQMQKDMAELRRDAAVMTKEKRDELQKKIMTEGSDLRKLQMDFDEQVMTIQRKAMGDFVNRVKQIVSTIAQKERYSAVIAASTAIYYDSNLDITNKVLDQLK